MFNTSNNGFLHDLPFINPCWWRERSS